MAIEDDVREIALALPEVTEEPWYQTLTESWRLKAPARLRKAFDADQDQ